MNRHGRVAALASAALLAGLGGAACDPETDWLTTEAAIPVHGEGAPGIDASVDTDVITFLAENDLPGATVAVTRAGRLVWSKGYGWAKESEQLPMQPWHRSWIGSVSKVITTIGLLQMLEEPGPAFGSLAAPGGSALQAKLAQPVYGHPGSDFDSPQWPTVTEPTVLADPESYWEAIRDGVQYIYPDTFDTDMARMIEWASSVELGHLLTHTSGLPRSGAKGDAAAAYHGIDKSELTYPLGHQALLAGRVVSAEHSANVRCYLDGELYVPKDDPDYTGQTYPMPGLLFEPGTKECYSNHGFGLLRYIIGAWSGPGATYEQVIRSRILEPLGLTDVVPRNTDISDLDAWPHGSSLNPNDPATSTATGGWAASAQDLTRIMCGIDRASNHLRLLAPQTVTTMETVAYPEASSTQPLGWDSINGNRLYKNGSIDGGRSVIIKYLPGKFETAPLDEINVAVNVNSNGTLPPESLLSSIATKVAAADIPDDYDLFDPAYACVVEPELDLVNPTPGPSTPDPSETLVAPATPTVTLTSDPTLVVPPRTRTPRIPPTVTIELPYNGWQPAPNGSAKIPFQGWATDAAGAPISGQRLRWTAIEGGTSTVLCAGSDFGPAPTTLGGIATVTDCTQFNRTFTNPRPGSGPSITIRLEAKDQSGLVGSDEVIIALFTPPTN